MPADDWIPPYEGGDMTGFLMRQSWELPGDGRYGAIRSVTNIRDTAIIVTVSSARICLL